jgi:hypothetical protein
MPVKAMGDAPAGDTGRRQQMDNPLLYFAEATGTLNRALWQL